MRRNRPSAPNQTEGNSMSFVHFIHVESSDVTTELGAGALARLRGVLREIPGLRRALIHLPARARHHFSEDGPPPRLALQLYYEGLEALEAPLRVGGALHGLAKAPPWAALRGVEVNHQAMYARGFPAADPAYAADPGEPPCSYLVHYPGRAEDLNAWLDYYLDHHPQIMITFPRVREIEIYTRIDWRDAMPWTRVRHMQRNRMIFDSRAALEAALESPVLARMRADFRRFPPFSGGNIHYPMLTEDLVLEGGR